MPTTFDWDALAHDSPTSSEENQMSDAHTMPFAEHEGSDVRDTLSPPATLVLSRSTFSFAPAAASATLTAFAAAAVSRLYFFTASSTVLWLEPDSCHCCSYLRAEDA